MKNSEKRSEYKKPSAAELKKHAEAGRKDLEAIRKRFAGLRERNILRQYKSERNLQKISEQLNQPTHATAFIEAVTTPEAMKVIPPEAVPALVRKVRWRLSQQGGGPSDILNETNIRSAVMEEAETRAGTVAVGRQINTFCRKNRRYLEKARLVLVEYVDRFGGCSSDSSENHQFVAEIHELRGFLNGMVRKPRTENTQDTQDTQDIQVSGDTDGDVIEGEIIND